jgi:hypothetical protein
VQIVIVRGIEGEQGNGVLTGKLAKDVIAADFPASIGWNSPPAFTRSIFISRMPYQQNSSSSPDIAGPTAALVHQVEDNGCAFEVFVFILQDGIEQWLSGGQAM